MKKLMMVLVLCFTLVMGSIPVQASSLTLTMNGKTQRYKGEQLEVMANGKEVDISSYPGIIEGGTALLPYKPVFNKALGVKTTYNKSKKTVTFEYDGNKVVVTLNSKSILVNGVKKTSSVAAKMVKYENSNMSLILVPSRFVAEALGFDYQYDSETSTVTIGKKEGMEIKYGGVTYLYEEDKTDISIDGQVITTDMPGLYLDGYVMVPVKAAASALGWTYSYSSANKQVTMEKAGKQLQMTVGSKSAVLGSNPVEMAAPLMTVTDVANNTSYNMVSAKFLAEASELNYAWKQEEHIVYLSQTPLDITTDVEGEIVEEPTEESELDYNIKVSLPDGVNKGDYSIEDDYHNKQFIITIPGDHSKYYKTNPVEVEGNQVSSSSVKVTSGQRTQIIFKTSSIKAFKIVEESEDLYIKAGKPKDIYDKVVVVDAGHGGSDPGAGGNGIYEKNVALSISLYAKEYLDQEDDIKVYYTRLNSAQYGITAGSSNVSNSSASLPARYNFANSVAADLFISVHINAAGSSSARGTEVYYSSSNKYKNDGGLTSSKLASYSYNNLVKAVGSSKRGVKTANFAVIKHTKMPAVLLEVAFITNKSDAAIMKNESKLDDIGKSVYDTVMQAFDEYPTGR